MGLAVRRAAIIPSPNAAAQGKFRVNLQRGETLNDVG
jgi:hypothetical protein